MGNSPTASPRVSQHPMIPESIPSFYYLNRSINTIFKVQPNLVSKHSLQGFHNNLECAVGYLPKGNIVIAGGVKPNGHRSKKVFYINVNTKEINRLASLKFRTKNGTLLYHESNLYYFSPDLTKSHQIYAKTTWNLLAPKQLALHSPSVFMHKNAAYFISGIKVNEKPTRKIYFLDLTECRDYQVFPLKVPFILHSPISIASGSYVAVGGGVKMTGENNYNYFFHWFGSDKWKEIEGPRVILENYPGVLMENAMIWTGSLQVVIILNKKFLVFNIKLSERKTVNLLEVNSQEMPSIKKIVGTEKEREKSRNKTDIHHSLKKHSSNRALTLQPDQKIFATTNLIKNVETVHKEPQKKPAKAKLQLKVLNKESSNSSSQIINTVPPNFLTTTSANEMVIE